MASIDPHTPATTGLSAAEAARRLSRDGPNALPQRDRRRWPQLLIGVLREPMLVLLIAAAAISGLPVPSTSAAKKSPAVAVPCGWRERYSVTPFLKVSAPTQRSNIARTAAPLA